MQEMKKNEPLNDAASEMIMEQFYANLTLPHLGDSIHSQPLHNFACVDPN